MEAKKEDDSAPEGQVPQRQDTATQADPVAEAMASLPRSDSLRYTARSGRAQSNSPALGNGDDGPSWQGRYDPPWDQGLWEDEAGGGLRSTQDECNQRGKGVRNDTLKLKIVMAGRGGRCFGGAIHTKPRRYAARTPGLKHDSAEHRFQTDSSCLTCPTRTAHCATAPRNSLLDGAHRRPGSRGRIARASTATA